MNRKNDLANRVTFESKPVNQTRKQTKPTNLIQSRNTRFFLVYPETIVHVRWKTTPTTTTRHWNQTPTWNSRKREEKHHCCCESCHIDHLHITDNFPTMHEASKKETWNVWRVANSPKPNNSDKHQYTTTLESWIHQSLKSKNRIEKGTHCR